MRVYIRTFGIRVEEKNLDTKVGTSELLEGSTLRPLLLNLLADGLVTTLWSPGLSSEADAKEIGPSGPDALDGNAVSVAN